MPSDRRGKPAEHRIDRWVANIEHGRFERSLSGLTAFAALVTTAEVYAEHYRASFGNKMMWSPILVTPPVVIAGVAGVYSKRWAKTALPIASTVYMLDGLIGEYYHVARRSPTAGRLRAGELQHPDGPAGDGARPDVDRRRDGRPGGVAAPGGLSRARYAQRQPSAQPARRRRAAPPGLAAAPARGDDPADGRAFSRLRRAGIRGRLGRGDARRSCWRAWNPPASCASSPTSRRPRCTRSAMSSSPRTTSRGSRSSSSSTRSSRPGGSTAISTRTCLTTATPGA